MPSDNTGFHNKRLWRKFAGDFILLHITRVFRLNEFIVSGSDCSIYISNNDDFICCSMGRNKDIFTVFSVLFSTTSLSDYLVVYTTVDVLLKFLYECLLYVIIYFPSRSGYTLQRLLSYTNVKVRIRLKCLSLTLLCYLAIGKSILGRNLYWMHSKKVTFVLYHG